MLYLAEIDHEVAMSYREEIRKAFHAHHPADGPADLNSSLWRLPSAAAPIRFSKRVSSSQF